jgi:hypothetical protein
VPKRPRRKQYIQNNGSQGTQVIATIIVEWWFELKLRFDGNMEESKILELLREVKVAPQYTILTFDEVTFDATITAADKRLLGTAGTGND